MVIMKNNFILQPLPPCKDLETKEILKQAVLSHRFLAELKGISKTIPNQSILIATLPLLEAKDSSAIENIITTHDDLYKESLFEKIVLNPAAKEVQNYARALVLGFEKIKKQNIFTNNFILDIQAEIVKNNAGYRKLPGTSLINDATGETVYLQQQTYSDIVALRDNLEKVIHDDTFYSIDPLIKMAVIHYQFESIHPFYDGNGRTGRIINVLYLVYKGLLDIPVLYLSRYIIKNKVDYYRLLQEVRDNESWEAWVLFILKAVEETSKGTIEIIKDMKMLMQDYKERIRTKYKFYSQDLLNNLFKHPYTKIEFIMNDLNINRQTAAKYLHQLVEGGFLEVLKLGKHNYYLNKPLFELFAGKEK
jgi:Fic family protein